MAEGACSSLICIAGITMRAHAPHAHKKASMCLLMGGPAPMAPSVAFAAFAMILPNFDASPEPRRPGKCFDPRLMLVSFARFRASRILIYRVPCSHTMTALAAYAALRGALCAARVCALINAAITVTRGNRAHIMKHMKH